MEERREKEERREEGGREGRMEERREKEGRREVTVDGLTLTCMYGYAHNFI